ncbi:hypothetical protein STEG23_036556 [Scotinomys teguina]
MHSFHFLPVTTASSSAKSYALSTATFAEDLASHNRVALLSTTFIPEEDGDLCPDPTPSTSAVFEGVLEVKDTSSRSQLQRYSELQKKSNQKASLAFPEASNFTTVREVTPRCPSSSLPTLSKPLNHTFSYTASHVTEYHLMLLRPATLGEQE